MSDAVSVPQVAFLRVQRPPTSRHVGRTPCLDHLTATRSELHFVFRVENIRTLRSRSNVV